jgi:hypothetical protein
MVASGPENGSKKREAIMEDEDPRSSSNGSMYSTASQGSPRSYSGSPIYSFGACTPPYLAGTPPPLDSMSPSFGSCLSSSSEVLLFEFYWFWSSTIIFWITSFFFHLFLASIFLNFIFIRNTCLTVRTRWYQERGLLGITLELKIGLFPARGPKRRFVKKLDGKEGDRGSEGGRRKTKEGKGG